MIGIQPVKYYYPVPGIPLSSIIYVLQLSKTIDFAVRNSGVLLAWFVLCL